MLERDELVNLLVMRPQASGRDAQQSRHDFKSPVDRRSFIDAIPLQHDADPDHAGVRYARGHSWAMAVRERNRLPGSLNQKSASQIRTLAPRPPLQDSVRAGYLSGTAWSSTYSSTAVRRGPRLPM